MREDLTIAVRRLLSRPAFTAAAVATLAVGIAATSGIFATVNATLLRPLAYPDSHELYTLRTRLVDGRWSSGRVTGAYFAAINETAPSVARAVAVLNGDAVLVSDDGRNRQLLTHGVSEGFFDIFGLSMAAGRGFVSEDHAAGGSVAVISHRLWEEALGRDPDVIGRSLRLATGPVQVIGVAPPDFDVPAGTDAWFSISYPSTAVAHNYEGYLRVRPGTTQEQLEAELATVMSGLAEQYPQAASGRAFVVRPLLEAIVGDLGPILLVVLAGAVVLLVLSCINVATLILARGASQMREMAVRAALGADRWSITRQFLGEAFVLSAAGTVAGLLLAFVGVRVLLASGAAALPRLDSIPFDVRVVGFVIVVLTAATVLIGLLPALRLGSPDIRGLLTESGRSATASRGTRRLLGGLVVAEITLAITLVAGAGWLVRSYTNLSNTDPGFLADGRLVFEAVLSGSAFAQPPVFVQGPDGQMVPQMPSATPMMWLQELSDRLMGSEQVRAVGSTTTFPLRTDWDAAYYVSVPGEPYDPNRQDTARRRPVSPDFFEAMGIRLLAGRTFTYAESAPIAVVNEAFVRRYLNGRDPLTTPFAWGFPMVNFNAVLPIVGVVADVRYSSLSEPADPIFYVPGVAARQTVVVSTTMDEPTPLIPLVREAAQSVDPSIPVSIQPLREVVDAALVRHRLGLILMVLFAAVSLGLAAIGIFGVIAHITGERTVELATRMTFGARPGDVVRLLMTQGRPLVLGGAMTGAAVAYIGGRIAAARLYEVRPGDPVILVGAVGAVVGITVVAYLLPALRASRIQAAEALRGE